MPLTLIRQLLRVETTDLAAAALPAGAGGGNSLYDPVPGDGSWNEAPDAAAPATHAFTVTVETFSVFVRLAGVEIRISSDDAANYGGWIPLPIGTWAIAMSATHVQVREDVDGGGAQYHIAGFA